MTAEEISLYNNLIQEVAAEIDAEVGYFKPAFSYRVASTEFIVEFGLMRSFSEIADDPQVKIFESLSTNAIVYIPVYNTSASPERAIGHVSINYFSEDDHPVDCVFLGDAHENTSDYIHFAERFGTLEKVKAECASLHFDDVTNAFLLSLDTSYNDFSEKILLIQASSGYYVYDFMNTLGLKEAQDAIYSLNEYITLRIPYEESHFYKTQTPVTPVSGGAANADKLKSYTHFWIVIPIICATVGSGLIVFIRKRKKSRNISGI